MESNKELAPKPIRPGSLINLNDRDLFGNAAGEDEDPRILNSYYIDLPRFENFYDLTSPLCIAKARKGMGKSALLSRFEYILKKKVGSKEVKAIIIKTTGSNLLGLGEIGEYYGRNHLHLESYWKQIICRRIIVEIGKEIGWAISDSQMTLVEAAEIEGAKSKNIISALISRMIKVIKIPPLELELKNRILPSNSQSLLNNYQEEHGEADVWLLIDDIDAKYINSDDYKNLISSFFSAIRSLAVEIKGLNIRATVRTDVWSNLRHFEDLDKCDQYIVQIDWSADQLKQMLLKRIHSYVKRKHPNTKEAKYDLKINSKEILNLVFIEKMPWGQKEVEAYVPITKYANYRPRWMGQLCTMAAKKAYEKEKPIIDIRHINKIMPEFGKNRVDDLIKEHGYQFANLDALINCFRLGYREYTYSLLKQLLEDKYISQVGILNIPLVDSHPYTSFEQLGEFLYKIEFLSNKERGATRFQDDPYLFKTIENREDKLIWTVHPIYRIFLRIN